MTDASEHSFRADPGVDSTAPHFSASSPEQTPEPRWRLRPLFKSIRARSSKRQILPRITLALRNLPQKAIKASSPSDASAIDHFAILALANEEDAALAYVETLLAQGKSVESIYLELLAPTARELGKQWETDATDFANVTLGVSRLQRIMRRLGDDFHNEKCREHCRETVLLTIIPGEQHSFGLSMVAEFFRRAGWNLSTGPFASRQELTSLVHHQWFDIVGFSISSDRRLSELKKDIQDIRRDSRNKQVGVVLGGPMMVAHPELVKEMGADMMSSDAATAPQQARDLVAQMKRHN